MGHDVQSSEFGFGGRGHVILDDVGNVEDGFIVERDFFVEGKEKVAPSMAACLGFTEVTGITVNDEFHFAAFVCKDGTLLHCQVVKELTCLFEGVGGGCR